LEDRVKKTICPVCGRIVKLEDHSLQCDEPRCPLKSATPVLLSVVIQLGEPGLDDSEEKNAPKAVAKYG
jgi:hypothetical protein